jgi:hypothetical protein
MTDEDFRCLEEMSGCRVVGIRSKEDEVERLLRPYKGLQRLRRGNVIARRLTDIEGVFDPDSWILSLDTDIFFRGRLELPTELPEFAYCVDEVPGYGGSAKMCLFGPVVRSLNGGVMLFRVRDLEFKKLDDLAERYLAKTTLPFWAEQSIFALLAGTTRDCRVFDPRQFDIVSGLKKRAEVDRLANETSYFSYLRSEREAEDVVKERVRNAWGIHFAGPGKPWIEYAAGLPEHERSEQVRFMPVPQMGMWERSKLALRVKMRETLKPQKV